jgi:dCMP deaminase
MTRWDRLFIDIAIRVSQESKSTRLKVGAVCVRENIVLTTGFNGTVSKRGSDTLEEDGVTTPDTIHAEENIILFAAKEGISIKGSTLYVTVNPCRHCAALLAQAGIVEVKFLNEYRDLTGLDKLKQYGVKITKLDGSIK